jgi:hypothetical protein
MVSDDLPLGELEPDDPEYGEIVAPLSEDDAREPKKIVLIVFAPKDPDPKRFRFLLDETVGEAAQTAATKFKYEAGNPSFQVPDGTVLDRSLTLRQAGLTKKEEVELVAAGGGV